MNNDNRRKMTGTVAGVLVVTALIGFAAATSGEKKDVSQKSSESAVVTNENGSVSRSFTESTVSTNGSMVTEHRRETRTTLDADGNVLATTTSEYAQSYPVGDTGMASLASRPLGVAHGEAAADADEPTLLRAKFTPKKALAGFDDYYVYVTPKTHKVVKVYACAKEAVDAGSNWRRNYLIEALEKRYNTWARPRSWCRPVYTFDIGSNRYVTACLAGSSRNYETVIVAWDDALLTTAADESEELRQAARKSAAERRRRRVSDTVDAF